MPLVGGTCNTTTTTMSNESNHSESLAPSSQDHINTTTDNTDNTSEPSSPTIEYEFDESHCLFCNHESPDQATNLLHMSKTHGLHIDTTNLLVDVTTLLAYFHLVISGYYECLYCGKQGHTRQAAQQHMMAKGHCKYDLTDKDAEIRDFYEFASSSEGEGDLPTKRQHTDSPLLAAQGRTRKQRSSRRADRASSPSATPSAPSQTDTTTDPTDPSTQDQQLTTPATARAQRQESNLNNQLAHLRAADRQSLLHLPASQQRALLATHHRQIEKANRAEQTQRGHLESAGNKFGRLDTVRLVRLPPHFGHVQGLGR